MNKNNIELLSDKQKVLLGLDIVSRVFHIYTELYPNEERVPRFLALVREKADIVAYPLSYFDKEFREVQKDFYRAYDEAFRDLQKHYPHSSAAIAVMNALIEAAQADVLRTSSKAIQAVKIISSIEPCKIEEQAHSELLASYIVNPRTSPLPPQ